MRFSQALSDDAFAAAAPGVMKWAPLLQGTSADQAIAVAWAIGEGLEALDTGADPSLANGHAGIGLLHAYLAAATGSEVAAQRAESRLDKAIEHAGTLSTVGLFGGLAGVAWTYHHVHLLLTSEVSSAAVSEVDLVLADALATQPWPWEFDLIYGLAGIGLYALEHPDRETGSRLAAQVVCRLSEIAEKQASGLTWKTKRELIFPNHAGLYPEGRYDLGLAHGVAGVVGFLARALSAAIAPDEAGNLLRGAIAWLESQERPSQASSRFPSFVGAGIEAGDTRSAWCYGTPGIAAAILSAGLALEDSALVQKAISLAEADGERVLEETMVVDAALCHGMAGLAHLYNVLGQTTDSVNLLKNAARWFDRTLQIRQPAKSLEGYWAWWPEARRWQPEPGLLGGAAGVALSLLAGATPVPPGWGKPFLLSI